MNKQTLLRILTLVIVFQCCCLSSAQQDIRNYLPISVPVSPEAADLMKAINYPVDYNTGVPNITIPLYELKSRGITFPISLSYHAGGFKTKTVAAVTGLGWDLSANLQIAREVHGLDDFKKSSISYYSGYYYNGYGQVGRYRDESLYTSQRIFEMAAGQIDSQPDHFYYNILGKSGSFYIMKKGNTTTFCPFPYNGLRITCIPSTVSNSSSVKFRISDTDGTEYNFEVSELLYDPDNSSCSYENSWKCTSIISPDKTDTLHISYERLTDLLSYVGNQYVELYEDLNGVQGQPHLPYGGTIFADEVEANAQYSYTQALDKFRFFNLSVPRTITFSTGMDNGLALFTKDGNYSEYSQKTIFSEGFNEDISQKRIQRRYVISQIRTSTARCDFYYSTQDYLFLMKITDSRNNLLRNIYFDQSTVGNYESMYYTNRTNYLDRIRFQGSSGNTQTYRFDYTEKYAFANYFCGGDLWGGVNRSVIDRRASVTRVPGFTVRSKYYTSNHYNATDTFSIWIGGFIGLDPVYQYMDTQYALVGQLKRIKYPTNGYTEFSFGPNYGYNSDSPYIFQIGGVRINKISDYEADGTLLKQKVYKYGDNNGGIPNGLYDYTSFTANHPFWYKQEVEYFYNPIFHDTSISATARGILETKTTFVANSIEDLYFSNGSPVYYEKVTEYDYNEEGENGKKEYLYTAPDRFGLFLHRKLGDTNLLRFDESWRMGRLEKENTYRSVGIQKYQLAHSVNYEYNAFEPGKELQQDMPYRRRIIMGVYDYGYNQYRHSEITDPLLLKQLDHGSYIALYSQTAATGAVCPIRKTETTYDGMKEMEVVTEYQYDSFYQPTYTTVSYADGSSDQTHISYAGNFSADIPFIQSMMNKNQIGVPVKIEQTSSIYGDNRAVNGIIRLFQPDNPALMDKIYALAPNGSQGGSSLDHGFTIPGGYYPKASLGYDARDCLVEIETNDNPRTVYLWGYDNQYPIAEIINSDYATVCNTLGNTVVQTLRSSYDSSYIRDRIQYLREHLPDARVTTFIHTPLVGLVEVVTPNGVKANYTYDGLRRLEAVKDHNGHTVTFYKYNHAGN